MTVYRGYRDGDSRCHVIFYGKPGEKPEPLPLRLDLREHSPTGFEWGYGGSGPAQLALALLAHALGDDKRAERLHQKFKSAHIAPIEDSRWTFTSEQIRAWADAAETAGL